MRWQAFSRTGRRPRRGARGAARRVPRRAAGGRAPHAPRGDDAATRRDPALLERLGVQPTRYEGPTGIVGVLHAACADAGLPVGDAVGGGAPLRRLGAEPKGDAGTAAADESLVGVSVDLSELESAALEYERQVGLAVQSDADIQAFVERLEQAVDTEEDDGRRSVPSGEALAREFQRFLRQRGSDED